LLTRMARSARALTACEPVVEPAWGELTLACSPSRGTDCLCAFGRSTVALASRGGGHPGPDSAGPEDRLSGPDHRIISRLARGQSFVLLIKREQSDAIAKAGGRLGP
jgi:hypothetical protein